MKSFLIVLEILVAVALTGLILIQAKGVGLGRTLGSAAFHSKRGVEKLVFRSTVVIAVLFTVVSVANHLFV